MILSLGSSSDPATVAIPPPLLPLKVNDDHAKVCKYLEDLDKPALLKIFTELGLKFSKVNKMNDAALPGEAVHSWLMKDGNVKKKSGEPSWDSLCRVLEDDHDGLATEIREKGS